MKNTLLLSIFLLLTVGICAQEVKTIDNENSLETTVSKNTNTSSTSIITTSTDSLIEDTICYAEISKVAFYKALIKQNGFNINIRENDSTVDIALKNTEEIIINNKERVSYSE